MPEPSPSLRVVPAPEAGPWTPTGPHPLVFSEIRIENTNRCGYKCFFCPRDLHTRDQGFMSLDDLALVLDRVGEHRGRVDLHGFGEPLLDRQLADKVALVRERWPASEPRIYSTLGARMKPGELEQLVVNGLRQVEVSFYGFDAETYRQVHAVNGFEMAKSNLEELCRLQAAYPGRFEVVVRAFPTHPDVEAPGDPAEVAAFRAWLEDLGIETVRERALHNYGNGRTYNPVDTAIPCSVTWGYRRRILQVTWDLHVIPCCFDFNAEVRFGNLRNQTLEEILHGEPYERFLDDHVHGRLEKYPVCQGCERCHQA
ncbi:MAG: SPASM domain-containing protein [Acidobacteria bacterium]|nr:SPASM domain-containing protein [Acidobacteriota bacterium]